MARVGIVFGLLLCGLTLVGLVGSLEKLPALFFPMMFGIPVLFCGVVALNPHRRRQSMHVAAVIALLGAVGGGAYSIYCLVEMVRGIEVDRYPLRVISAMSALCLLFVVICVYSLVQSRRRKQASEAARSKINLHQVVDKNEPAPVKPSSRESA